MGITICRSVVHHSRILKWTLALLVPKLKWKGKPLTLLLMLACGVTIVDAVWIKNEVFKALVRIDPLPRTNALVDLERYAEAYEYLDFFMQYDYVRGNLEAVQLYHEIEAHRRNILYRLGKAAEGIVRGTSDELEGQISAVASDFFVIGDIRDLALESLKWSRGEDVDEFTAALSATGPFTHYSILWAACHCGRFVP
jgi:hypothetical protein